MNLAPATMPFAPPPVHAEDHDAVRRDAHREDVVRRLLLRGISTRTLRALLPEWDQLIRVTSTRVEVPLPRVMPLFGEN